MNAILGQLRNVALVAGAFVLLAGTSSDANAMDDDCRPAPNPECILCGPNNCFVQCGEKYCDCCGGGCGGNYCQ